MSLSFDYANDGVETSRALALDTSSRMVEVVIRLKGTKAEPDRHLITHLRFRGEHGSEACSSAVRWVQEQLSLLFPTYATHLVKQQMQADPAYQTYVNIRDDLKARYGEATP